MEQLKVLQTEKHRIVFLKNPIFQLDVIYDNSNQPTMYATKLVYKPEKMLLNIINFTWFKAKIDKNRKIHPNHRQYITMGTHYFYYDRDADIYDHEYLFNHIGIFKELSRIM